MENFLKDIGGVGYVKKYLSRLKNDGVESVEDLRYLKDQDYNEMGFKRLHKRKIMTAVLESYEASAAPRSTIKQETKESSLEEKVQSEKNWKTLEKLQKGLSGLFSPKRLSELTAFVRRDIDKGITLAALKLVHDQASFLKQLLIKTVESHTLELSTKQAACHTFFSHVQKYAGDLCRSLSIELRLIGIDVWYDMDAERLDARGMIQGIISSTYFTLVATKEYFERPWPVFEALIANIFNKPILVLLESDSRHGGLTFEDFASILPDPWASLKSHEFLKIERRGSFWKATIDELRKRLSKTPAIYNYIGWEQERASKSDAVETILIEGKDHRKQRNVDTDAAMLRSIITLAEPPKKMGRSRNDLVGLELVQPEDAAQALAEKIDRSPNFDLELEPIQPEDTAASKSDAVETILIEDKDHRKQRNVDTDAAMLRSIITLAEPPKKMGRSRNDLVGLELVQPEDAAQALAEKIDRSPNFDLELEPIQPEDTAFSLHTLYRPNLFQIGKKPLVQQNHGKGINETSLAYKVRHREKRWVGEDWVREKEKRWLMMMEELKVEEDTYMLPTESKSNQHEKAGRIRTDSELIHHMLYSSDSPDSFELKNEEDTDMLPTESKSNQHEKGGHIRTDTELIDHMLYSSDSPDSFECEQVQQNQEKGINKSSLACKVRERPKRKMIIEEVLKNEEKTDMLPTESKSNQHEKAGRIRTDSELIHQMMYSSDSPDSFLL